MSAYNNANQPNKTLELFHEMEKETVMLRHVTFLSVIRSLTQLGSSTLARSIIDRIPQSILVIQEVQTALIDMWASALLFHSFTALLYLPHTGQNRSHQ